MTIDQNRWKKYNEVVQLSLDFYDQMLRIEEYLLKHSQFNDITPKALHVILAIGLHGDQRISDVAKHLDVSKGTLSAQINVLEEKDYVKRIPDKHDRRVIFLTLANRGRLLYRAHNAIHRKIMTEYLKEYDDEEIDNAKQALVNVDHVIREVRKHEL